MTSYTAPDRLRFGVLALAVWLGACTPMTAQNPPGSLKPVDAVAQAMARAR